MHFVSITIPSRYPRLRYPTEDQQVLIAHELETRYGDQDVDVKLSVGFTTGGGKPPRQVWILNARVGTNAQAYEEILVVEIPDAS